LEAEIHKKGENAVDTFELIEKLKIMVKTAMFAAIKSHDLIFDENKNDSIAVAYLNKTISHISAAEALYYAKYDDLAHNDVEEIFHLFDVYTDELLSNYETNHSHQWTDIEFTRLKEAFDNSVFANDN
jgi:hypothetical protein